ncbi:unnamed protein product [Phytophthora fragariaefolia]|uniref:Unnamed protein product n=1 Tax=Phytophthora fragariaefolia TaxID=1490495 RepID=A0A9W6XR81_9STRA|nr:unnamed protein product [Phytophthora fragariaefolia]
MQPKWLDGMVDEQEENPIQRGEVLTPLLTQDLHDSANPFAAAHYASRRAPDARWTNLILQRIWDVETASDPEPVQPEHHSANGNSSRPVLHDSGSRLWINVEKASLFSTEAQYKYLVVPAILVQLYDPRPDLPRKSRNVRRDQPSFGFGSFLYFLPPVSQRLPIKYYSSTVNAWYGDHGHPSSPSA